MAVYVNEAGYKGKLTSRERVIRALNFQPVDRVPVDLGSSPVTGAHVSIVAGLRKAFGYDKKEPRVKVNEPYQMLGEVDEELRKALELDVVGVPSIYTLFGFKNENWKPWRTFDGTDVFIPDKFNTVPESNGEIFMYPEGDKTAPASGKMPKGGFYFDSIVRQPPIDESKLNPKDNLEEFTIVSDEDWKVYEKAAKNLYESTDAALMMIGPGCAFGDIALVPAPWLKNPKGIRDIEEWYVSTIARKDYIKEVFSCQADIAIKNLEKMKQAVGDRIQIIFMDGTDLSSQNSLFCSPDSYRELYMPYTKKVNDWIHKNTKWKTFKHCCGACVPLIDILIEAGYDILNPIQTSATGMDPEMLADRFGGRIVFWGGGVDTQRVLPFGTPQEVFNMAKDRVRILNKKNGFVFNPVHNVQCNVPIKNMLAMFKALGRNVPEL